MGCQPSCPPLRHPGFQVLPAGGPVRVHPRGQAHAPGPAALRSRLCGGLGGAGGFWTPAPSKAGGSQLAPAFLVKEEQGQQKAGETNRGRRPGYSGATTQPPLQGRQKGPPLPLRPGHGQGPQWTESWGLCLVVWVGPHAATSWADYGPQIWWGPR